MPRQYWFNQPFMVAVVLVMGILMVLARLWFQLLAPPLPDETYYWLWGQRWDWSYFDHPPLQAWLQGGLSAAGADGLIGLRILPTLLTTAILLGALGVALRSRGVNGLPMLAVLAVFLASPVIQIFTMIAFPDHLMLALLMPGLLAATAVLSALDKAETPRPVLIHATGLLFGLAILTKYNAALVALALFILILWHRPYRALFRNPHFHLSIGILLTCLFPVLWWNLSNDAESFRYNFQDRLAFRAERSAINAVNLVLHGAVAFSVFLIPALVRVLRSARTDALHRVAVAAFAVPSLVWLAATPATHVVYYWNITAYLFILPLTILAIRSAWAVLAHMALGIALTVGMAVNYAHVPLTLVIGQTVDHETRLTYGWNTITPRIVELSEQHHASRLVASDYRYGALLAWFADDRTVEVLSTRRSQFDIWQGRAQPPRDDAIILTSSEYPLAAVIAERFHRVSHLEQHRISWRGEPIVTWDIWLGVVDPER